MIDSLKDKIFSTLKDAFTLDRAQCPAVVFTPAPAHAAADLSLTWALSAAKKIGKKPAEIAARASSLIAGIGGVQSAVSLGGYINITLSPAFLSEGLSKIIDANPAPFSTPSNGGKKINLEFVSANPTGPLHVASGRAASLGDSLSRILQALGYNVAAEYYVNDCGNQAELLGVSLKARREGKEPPQDGYQGSYLSEMALSMPDTAGWTGEDYSHYAVEKLLASHMEDMRLFRVGFDTWFRESALHREKAVEKTFETLKNSGLTHEKDGAVWLGAAQPDEKRDDKDEVLIRSDGRPTYFLADIAYLENKFSRGFDTLIDIWGADHHGHAGRMKAAAQALGHAPGAFDVILHQMVALIKGGKPAKMSKRAGEFVTLRELAQEAGVDACRFFFALRTPQSHMNFDMDLAQKKTQENPVFYVQYVHARVCSIFKNAGPDAAQSALPAVPPATITGEEKILLVKMALFKDALEACARDRSPHHLANYLLELAGLFHPFYDKCRVLACGDAATGNFRLFICQAVKFHIKYGLNLLGVSAPESM